MDWAKFEKKRALPHNSGCISNVHDEDAFDAMAGSLTLEPLAERIRCPTLPAMGEFDELCPREDAERPCDMMNCPKELWVYENEAHTLGGRFSDFHPAEADWLRDALDGRFGADHARRTFIPAR
ncbi:MAG: hypothetical protein V3V62_03405 [bacterium]